MLDLVLCRVEGCTRASVAQTGPWKGWCGEHKHLRGKKPIAAASGPAVEDPAVPPPAAEPARPASVLSLVELAQDVEKARGMREAADRDYRLALERLRDAATEAAAA